MIGRAVMPIATAMLGLAGSLAVMFVLHRAATEAIDRALEERLRGAGETAAALLSERPDSSRDRLREVMEANRLEGAYVISSALEIVADATGPSGVKADLLRVDAERVEEALGGRATVARAYDVGTLKVETAYFPVRSSDGTIRSVVALEAGRAFAEARTGLRRALLAGMALAGAGAVALAMAAAGWSRAERSRREAAAKAARGETLSRMAATVAHEIRNPIGIIRGAVELVGERAGERLEPRDRERLRDVVGEVERLRRLTEEFLDLAADRQLQEVSVELGDIAGEAARGSAVIHPDMEVLVSLPPGLTIHADPGRLRQVLSNLLANSAQAGARSVRILAEVSSERVTIRVQDDGRGVAPGAGERIFDPFETGREGGTGLGLAVSRRIVERHGGTLALVLGVGPGATFEIRLPRRQPGQHAPGGE